MTPATSISPTGTPARAARPCIGITPDVDDERCTLSHGYARVILASGGFPIVLPPEPETLPEVVALCAGFVLTGGDDPRMEEFGEATHPKVKPIHPQRQRFELALLRELDEHPAKPVLGVCLGMQLMALHRGGTLDQYLPETLPSHADHWDRREHPISGELGEGMVQSHHRQAIVNPGSMRVVARAHDGVIEAVADDPREGRFYLGAQWHPERTEDRRFGAELFVQLVEAARESAPSPRSQSVGLA